MPALREAKCRDASLSLRMTALGILLVFINLLGYRRANSDNTPIFINLLGLLVAALFAIVCFQ